MEELLGQHRKEKHDLQSKITQKKKNATKKTKKGVNDECDRLERELAEKQSAEVRALSQPNDLEGLETAAGDLSIEDPTRLSDAESKEIVGHKKENDSISQPESGTEGTTSLPGQGRQKKPNRQKARLARRAADQEAQVAAAAEEAANLPDRREQEVTAMKQQMEKLGLKETLIRPDGHCLFSACAHSMSADIISQSGPHKEPYRNVRHASAGFMQSHPDDFAGFLEEPLEVYVKKITDTAEWGGQLELQAIARSYHVDINVLQADGRIEKIASESSEHQQDQIWLAYYRHSFGLGEHYNALNKAEKS